MSGLLLGLMLRRAGWQARIHERVGEELSGRGAGIVAQPELIAILQRLGLETSSLGVEVERRRLFDSAGHIVGERDCAQLLTAWERVYRILRDAFPVQQYSRGSELLSFRQSHMSVVARFSDGDVESDLLVGADGLRSTVRRICLPDIAPRYAGYVAWRALVPESIFPERLHDDLFGYMSFCLPPGEQMLGYPVAGPDNDLRPGHRRYNLIWYRPAQEDGELRELLTGEDGTRYDISIPPPAIRRSAIEAMRRDARRLLAPQFADLMDTVSQPILQPIYDLESEKMAFGRVAIVGDAAFVARPHVAAGVSKAAEDAAALVSALDRNPDIGTALASFEAARAPVGRRIIRRARHLGAYLQAQRTSEEEQALSRQHSVPEAVLKETALTDFLYS